MCAYSVPSFSFNPRHFSFSGGSISNLKQLQLKCKFDCSGIFWPATTSWIHRYLMVVLCYWKHLVVPCLGGLPVVSNSSSRLVSDLRSGPRGNGRPGNSEGRSIHVPLIWSVHPAGHDTKHWALNHWAPRGLHEPPKARRSCWLLNFYISTHLKPTTWRDSVLFPKPVKQHLDKQGTFSIEAQTN